MPSLQTWFGHMLCTSCIFVMAVELTFATFLHFCLVACVYQYVLFCAFVHACWSHWEPDVIRFVFGVQRGFSEVV